MEYQLSAIMGKNPKGLVPCPRRAMHPACFPWLTRCRHCDIVALRFRGEMGRKPSINVYGGHPAMKLFSSFALILTLLGPALSSAAPIPSPHSLQVESPPAAPGSESASLRVLESTAGRVVLELTTPGYRVETVETPQGVFAHPVVDGLSDLRTPGLPQLPQQSVLVAVPPGATVRLEVATSEGQATAVTDQLLPAPRAVLPQDVVGSVDAMAKVDRDEPVGTVNVYEPAPIDALPGGIYPQAVTEMGEAAILRGYQVVPVRLFPVQADLDAGTLTLHKTLQVTVHFDFPAGVSAPTNDPTHDPYYEPVLRASIINYEQARAWRQNMPNPGPVPSNLQAGDFKFVGTGKKGGY